jgi:polysaccharide biosynthesis protein PslG
VGCRELLALAAIGAAIGASACATADPTLPALGVAAGPDLGARTSAARARELDDYLTLGVTWVRHDVAWDVAEPAPGRMNWAPTDAVVIDALRRGLSILYTISYTPAWANGGHADHRYAPTDPAQFGAFAGKVAARYGQFGVHAYEIWNEPNISYWKPRPDPARYTAVLRAAASAIRRADPAATIITGGTSPAGDSGTTFSPHSWLRALYANGAKPWFDAVGHHPYVDSDVGPTSTDPGNPWFQMAGSTPSLRSIEIENGDADKRIWATEVGCRRSLGNCAWRLSVAAGLWRSYPWAGVMAWFTYWDPNEYGLVSGDWTQRPTWSALRYVAAADY